MKTKKEIDLFLNHLRHQLLLIGDNHDNFYYVTFNEELVVHRGLNHEEQSTNEKGIIAYDLKSKNLVTINFEDINNIIFISIGLGFTPSTAPENELVTNGKRFIDKFNSLQAAQISSKRDDLIVLRILNTLRGLSLLDNVVPSFIDEIDLKILSYDKSIAQDLYNRNKSLFETVTLPVANILVHFDKNIQLSIINEPNETKKTGLLKACWVTVLENKRIEYIKNLTKKLDSLDSSLSDLKFLQHSIKTEIENIKKIDFLNELSYFFDRNDFFFYWPFNNFNLETDNYILSKQADLASTSAIEILTEGSDTRIKYNAFNDYLVKIIKAVNSYIPEHELSADTIQSFFEVGSLTTSQIKKREEIRVSLINNKINVLNERRQEVFRFLDEENDTSDINVLKDIEEIKKVINDNLEYLNDTKNKLSILEILTYWPAVLQPAPEKFDF